MIVHQLTAHPGRAQPAALRARLRRDQPPPHRGHGPPAVRGSRAGGSTASSRRALRRWPFARVGGPVKTEEDPLDTVASNGSSATTLDAILHLERGGDRAPPGREGMVLRYGGFYGPGTSLGSIRRRAHSRRSGNASSRWWVSGGGVWSFIHIDDAARATAAASSTASPASTTWSTTSPPRWPSGSPRGRSARSQAAQPAPAWLARIAAGEPLRS